MVLNNMTELRKVEEKNSKRISLWYLISRRERKNMIIITKTIKKECPVLGKLLVGCLKNNYYLKMGMF